MSSQGFIPGVAVGWETGGANNNGDSSRAMECATNAHVRARQRHDLRIGGIALVGVSYGKDVVEGEDRPVE